MESAMIELDDAVGCLNLGVNEYVVLKALEINRIRQFLLLDIERIVTVKEHDATVSDRLAAWQVLLRKYLTYEMIEQARAKDDIEKEDATIHEPLSKTGLDSQAVSALKTMDITTIRDLIDLEDSDMETLDKGLVEKVTEYRQKYCDKDLIATVEKDALLEIYNIHAGAPSAEPVQTVGEDEFTDQAISESGINPNELEVLRALKIETVQQFLDMDINRTYEIKGYPDRTHHRLHSWQKYLQKRLHYGEEEEQK